MGYDLFLVKDCIGSPEKLKGTVQLELDRINLEGLLVMGLATICAVMQTWKRIDIVDIGADCIYHLLIDLDPIDYSIESIRRSKQIARKTPFAEIVSDRTFPGVHGLRSG